MKAGGTPKNYFFAFTLYFCFTNYATIAVAEKISVAKQATQKADDLLREPSESFVLQHEHVWQESSFVHAEQCVLRCAYIDQMGFVFLKLFQTLDDFSRRGIMSERKESEEFFAHLKAEGVTVTSEQMERIQGKIDKLVDYVPKVGILGKTGVGKSTLCNALFGKDVAEVDHIDACTWKPEEYFIMLSKEEQRGIVIIDTPGIGYREDVENDALYRDLLPKLDAILWIVKADDRAYRVEQQFYRDLVEPYLHERKPFIIVMNQVDKVEPLREWDVDNKQPGPTQLENIEKKTYTVRHLFGTSMSKVVFVSAAHKYNLIALVEEIVSRLPEQKVYGSVREVELEKVEEPSIFSVAKSQLQVAYQDVVVPLAKKYADEALEIAAEKIKEEIMKKLSSSNKKEKQNKLTS